jgi:subtilase family serine protease
MRKARIVALVAGAGTLAAAVAVTTPVVPAAPAAGAVVHGTAPVNMIVKPGAVREGKTDKLGPPSTAYCETNYKIACYQPGQVRAAYNLPALYAEGVTGGGTTIVIVDSFGSPTIARDLATFDAQFGYPAPPSLRIITPAGKIPAYNPDDGDMVGWAGETTLDVEYAHAIAPGANILLVETPVSETEGVTGFPQIVKAEQYVIDHHLGDVISQSFSATEETFMSSAQLAPLRAAYVDAYAHHVTVLTASGDSGAADVGLDESTYYLRPVTSWPDSDPLVTGVGGTQLRQSARGGFTSVVWNDTFSKATNEFIYGDAGPNPLAGGGGKSVFFGRPAYQNGVASVVGASRGVPDISMSAACDGAVDTYSSFAGAPAGWSVTCGTSEATPEFAGVVALADQVAGRPLGLINPELYALSADHAPGIVDVTSGNNSVSFDQADKRHTVKGFAAAPGYDLASGVGTINAPAFVHELADVAGLTAASSHGRALPASHRMARRVFPSFR